MTRSGLLRDAAFPVLKELLIARTGLAYFVDREEDLAERVARRMTRLTVPDVAAYVARLQSPLHAAAELEAITAELTIGETYFFRYHEQFDALRDRVIPELLELRAATRTLRFWSAGCATGPEPYSLAILLKRHFGARLAGWNVRIVGSDLNPEFLKRAQEARYGTWALRTLSEEQKLSAFERDGEEWTLRPEFREGVSFVRHNLVGDPLPSLLHDLHGFDVILCRNVMIYFDRPTIAATVSRLRGCLRSDGWLLVGHSEPNLELFQAWQMVAVPGATLYRNAPAGSGSAGVTGPGPLSLPALSGMASRAAPGSRPESQAFSTAGGGPALPITPGGSGLAAGDPLFPGSLGIPPAPAGTGARRERGELEPSAAPGCRVAGSPAGAQAPLENLRTLANRAQWTEIEDLCVELESRERLNPHFHFYRAAAAEGLGRAEEAERYFRQALFLNRSFAPAHYHLGLLLEARGELRQAERSYRNAVGILARVPGHELTAEGDGVTAAELRHVVELRLARLQERE